MDRPLAFVTGNGAKYESARAQLAGYGVEIERLELDLDEIQSPAAFGMLGRPLFVEDSGFAIDELGGWPGPMVKQLVDAVGAAGVSHLADLTATRRCRFTSALVYVDRHGHGHGTFNDDGKVGTIAHAPVLNPTPESWSPLWQVFIPRGATVPLVALSGAERDRVFTQWRKRSVFAKFGRWLTSATACEP